jgi:undecaprenyl-diphosphatase
VSARLDSIVRSGWNWTRNQDLVVLVMLFVLVGGTWVFIELAGEVRAGKTSEIDRAVLRAFRSPNDLSDPIGSRSVEEGVRDITALGSPTVLSGVVAAVAGFLLFSRKLHASFLVAVAYGGGLLLTYWLKLFFNRPRPEYVTALHYVDSHSFPSGHSMLAAVVYLTLGALLARLAPTRPLKIYVLGCAILLAFLVGMSRVYLGVHYPSDVLAGWTVGLLWAIICWLTVRYLQRRGKVEHPSPRPS